MTRFAFLLLALGLTVCATGDSRTDTILGLSGDAAGSVEVVLNGEDTMPAFADVLAWMAEQG